MSINRYNAKTDKTQAAIIRGLEQAGVRVWIIKLPCDLLCLVQGPLATARGQNPRGQARSGLAPSKDESAERLSRHDADPGRHEPRSRARRAGNRESRRPDPACYLTLMYVHTFGSGYLIGGRPLT